MFCVLPCVTALASTKMGYPWFESAQDERIGGVNYIAHALQVILTLW